MNTLTPQESFQKLGYAIFPNALSAEEVTFLREFFLKMFARKSSDNPADIIRHEHHLGDIYFNVYERFPELQRFLFHPSLISAVTTLLGERPYYYPCSCAMAGIYGFWHRDTDTEESRGYSFFREPDFNMITAAFYLQDNTTESGGGIDVVAGSHNSTRKVVPKLKKLRWADPTFLEGIGYRLKDASILQEDDLRITNKAGDLVIFKTPILHKASTGKGIPLAPENEKVALFHNFASRSKSSLAWIDYIRELKLKEYAHLEVPAPESLRKLADEAGVEYFSIDAYEPALDR